MWADLDPGNEVEHLPASAYVGLWLCSCDSENQPLQTSYLYKTNWKNLSINKCNKTSQKEEA